tara:strand:+ start:1199 stop:2032 length:834 start_codon:yes stop_codon:yes gene_type:complete
VTRLASLQRYNLWGRSEGDVDSQIHLSHVPDSSPAIATLEFEHSNRMDSIPPHAEVNLILIYNLVSHVEKLGRLDQYLLPDGTTNPKNGISLKMFGSEFGKASWQVKIVEPEEPGRVWAWTKKKRINQGEGLIGDGKGGHNLRIKKDQLPGEMVWDIQFHAGECPSLVVNTSNPEFYEDLKRSSSFSASLLIPEAVGIILDKVIVQMFDGDYALDTDRESWQYKWIEWVDEKIAVSRPHSLEPGELGDWINWKKETVDKIRSFISQSTKVQQRMRGE